MDEGLPGGDDDTLLGDTQLALRGGGSGSAASTGREATLRDSSDQHRHGRTLDEIRIGRYLIQGTLGQGGMGRVLRAHDETLGRDVALKVLLDTHGGRHGKRLLREAQALARLKHPNVVSVFDVAEIDGRLCMAMELVQGTPLDRWQKTPRPWSEAVGVYLQAGRGLAAAHAEGLIHRDFKPANCMLEEQGTVKVLDFGLARGVGNDRNTRHDDDEQDDESGEGAVTSADRGQVLRGLLEQQLTQTGAMLGTLAYMAPEQLLGEPADARSDQFSFCVSLFEAMFGKRPFVATSALGHLHAIQSQRVRIPPVPEGCPPVPTWLVEVLQRGLSVASDLRWPSMDALLSALERGLARRKRIRNGAVGAALVAGLFGALYYAGTTQDEPPCAGLRDQPMPAWTADDRKAVGDAIEASGLQDAERVRESVVTQLDDYATRWVDANAEACEATLVRHDLGEQALLRRRSCLDERSVHMRAAVRALTSADAPTLALAPEVVDRLPELATCDDVETLLRGPEPIPEALADRAANVRELVAQSWITSATGHDASGVKAADEAVTAAQAIPEAPVLQLEALLNRGEVLRLARRWSDARRDLDAALELAERLQDSTRTLDVLTQLVLLDEEREDLSAAETALSAIRGKLTRLEDQPRRAAQRWWLEGVVALQADRHDDALSATERAVKLYDELSPPVPEEHFGALMLLGETHRRHQAWDDARKAFERAFELAQAGGRLPAMARALHSLGHLDYEQGHLDAARATFERVLALRELFYGEQATPNIRTRQMLAVVLYAQGDLPQAFEQAELAQQSLDDEVPAQIRGEVHELLGGLQRARSQWSDAIASYRKAEEAWRSLPEPNRVDLAGLDGNIADSLAMNDEEELARELYDRALAAYETDAPESPQRAYALFGRGKLLLWQGQPKLAVRDFEKALAIEPTLQRDPMFAADLRWNFGKALLASGDADPHELQAAAANIADDREFFAKAGFGKRVRLIDEWLESCGSACESNEAEQSTGSSEPKR